DLVIERVAIDGEAPAFELTGPAFHARLAVGLDEQLDVGVRADFRADIATVEHGAARLRRELPLEGKERRADLGNDGHPGGHGAGLRRRQGVPVAQGLGVEAAGCGNGARHEFGALFNALDSAADRTVEQAGVEMGQAVVVGKAGSQGSLARRGWAVYGDNHDTLIPNSGY